MLKDSYEIALTEFDLMLFAKFVPPDHYLRQLKAIIDFAACRPLVAACYSLALGRTALDPVLLIKLLLLQRHYNLSDDALLRQVQVNLAFRYFLDLPSDAVLPEPSLLSQFRTRLGDQQMEAIFQEIVRQARAAGLIKDRLRLKDATHIVANIAVPTTLSLVAQVRTQLLAAAECFAPAEVAAQQAQVVALRQASAEQPNEVRLLRRVTHLRELVAWGDEWQARLAQAPTPLCSQAQAEAFATALALAHKVLQDRAPKAADKLVALTDPEARRAKHGDYFDGYKVDVSLDADSNLICALEVLPANGDEAADAKHLIESEEAAHGNNIESLSLDSIGYNGAMLEALSDDPNGPQLTVYVPVKTAPPRHPELYQAEDFKLNAAGDELTCPQGEKTKTRYRDQLDHGSVYHFSRKQCRHCPLRAQCLPPNQAHARRVSKNDYQAQYRAAQARTTTAEYQQIRKEHPAIERKLNELVRWHDGRRVRYRGRLRVRAEYLLLAVVVNCKRIVRLLAPAPAAQPA